MSDGTLFEYLQAGTRDAVAHYWRTRLAQQQKQNDSGRTDQGWRAAVTGGAQMDGFTELFRNLLVKAGIPEKCIYRKSAIDLPGYFRPTKEWDLLVIKNHVLIAAMEAKSQAGPSFGNNFNNRTEEAMGSALDLWTAYREQAYLQSPAPFVGYFFMLEDCPSSNKPVKARSSHFRVFPEFVGASYMRRYELFCRKLVLERHYSSAAFICSCQDTGLNGTYSTPASDLSVTGYVKALMGHVSAFV